MPAGLAEGLVTVVIPVWDDYAPVVGEAVESVRRQDLEASLLIVDNASRRRLPRFPPDVTTVRLAERVSVGAARNVGLSLAHTEYVLFLDADDVLAAGTLSLLVEELASAPSSAACCCGVVAWNARSGRVVRLDFPSRLTRAMARWAPGYRLYAALGNRMPTTGCVLMRTSFARAAGGFTDAEFAEDWPLNVGLAFRGPIRFLDPVGRHLRVHATSLRARRRSRVEVARAYALLRSRLESDRATPAVLRLALPLLALHHARQVRRLTPDGTTSPGRALALVGDSGPLTAERRGEQP
jgi:glycosyltransferase involved in cell wall biosynthesis